MIINLSTFVFRTNNTGVAKHHKVLGEVCLSHSCREFYIGNRELTLSQKV